MTWRGETDAAFTWLERAANSGDSSLMYLKFDPLMHKLRDDPRYRALLARLAIPLEPADAQSSNPSPNTAS